MENLKIEKHHNLISLLIFGLILIMLSSCAGMPTVSEKKKKAEKFSVKKDLVQMEQKNAEDYASLTVFLNDGINLVSAKVEKVNGDELNSILNILKNGLEERELYRTIPDGDIVRKVEKEEKTVKIYLGEDYPNTAQVVSILIRSSLVKSYTSLEGVEFVEFYYDNLPLKDSNNMPYGAYSFDDIVYDNELLQEIVYLDKINIYYPRDGFLEVVLEEVDVSMNDSIEDIVIKMLKTKSERNPMPVVPIDTKFINADIIDGTCYLNLNEAFLHNNSGSIEDTLAIYSIVNTITDLPDIAKVQFLINGEKMEIIRAGKDFNEPFEYNYELVKK